MNLTNSTEQGQSMEKQTAFQQNQKFRCLS